MDLHGEEVPKVQDMLREFHIHDAESATQSIQYLQQHIKEAKEEVTTLQQKSVDLDQADSNLAKADKLLRDEKQKVRSSLSELIRQDEKDRGSIEARLDERMRTIREGDEKYTKLAEQEIAGREKLAKKIIDLELLQGTKADDLEFKEVELEKKGERLGAAQKELKKDKAHLRQYLSHVEKEESKAKRVAKEWVEKQRERVSADKDAMLKKYLRSRQDNEDELRLAEERMEHRRKIREVQEMKLDDLTEDSWDRVDEPRPVRHSKKHRRHHGFHSEAQVSDVEGDYDDDSHERQLHRLDDLKRSIADDDDYGETRFAEEHHKRRRGMPPYTVRAGRQ